MGLLAGTVLYPSISETKTKKFSLWGIRIVALVLAIVAFALTTKNFCESRELQGVGIRKQAADSIDTDDPVRSDMDGWTCHRPQLMNRMRLVNGAVSCPASRLLRTIVAEEQSVFLQKRHIQQADKQGITVTQTQSTRRSWDLL
jgi:hypothetical protein